MHTLCRGNGASVLRIVPYAALHFGAYEHYRQVLVKAAASMSNSSVSNYVVPPSLDLVAGSAAGATAVLVNALLFISIHRITLCRTYSEEGVHSRICNSGNSRVPCPCFCFWHR